MKRLMTVLVAACAAIALSGTASADTQKVGDYTWTYTVDGDVAYIYNGGNAAVSPLPTDGLFSLTTESGEVYAFDSVAGTLVSAEGILFDVIAE